MTSAIHVNPFRCRMWSMHDRLDDYITEQTCRAEIDSVRRHGQLVPVLGRPLHGNPEHEVELIYGSRRLFVARHLNKPLLVEVRAMSDRDALIAMDAENRHRKDISAYERGLSYANWLRSRHFESQDEIARALNVSSSQISRLLKLARLPSVVVAAFPSPAEICEGWGLEIIEALEDPQRRTAVLRAARAIGRITPLPAAREIYQQLLGGCLGRVRTRKPTRVALVVKDARGTPLFRIQQRMNSVAIVLPLVRVPEPVLEGIRSAISGILQTYTDAGMPKVTPINGVRRKELRQGYAGPE